MLKKLTLAILGAILLTVLLTGAPESKRGVLGVVMKLDKLYRSNTSVATAEMEIITPHWKRTLRIDMWTETMDKTFMRILSPRKERGVSTLRIKNEMWNYLPRTNKVIKIPPSMMMGSWMGSDFTNDDLVKEFTFTNDYKFSRHEYETPEEGKGYIKCVPKPGRPIVWGYIIICYDKKNTLPCWYKYYDEKGKLMREMIFDDVKKLGNRLLPAEMKIVPTGKKGKMTIVRYLDLKFDVKAEPHIYSLRNLRKRI